MFRDLFEYSRGYIGGVSRQLRNLTLLPDLYRSPKKINEKKNSWVFSDFLYLYARIAIFLYISGCQNDQSIFQSE